MDTLLLIFWHLHQPVIPYPLCLHSLTVVLFINSFTVQVL